MRAVRGSVKEWAEGAVKMGKRAVVN